MPAYTTTINSTFLFNGRPYFSNPQTVGRNYYFKSVEFESLSGFDSLLQNAKYVTLEYTPTILISPWDSNNFYNFKYRPAISTGIEVGGTFIPNSVYVTRFSAPNPVESNVLPPISSNVFSKKIVMQLDRQNFLNAATNGLSIVHVFENLTDFYLTYLAYTVDVSIFTPRSNALFISIYN